MNINLYVIRLLNILMKIKMNFFYKNEHKIEIKLI